MSKTKAFVLNIDDLFQKIGPIVSITVCEKIKSSVEHCIATTPNVTNIKELDVFFSSLFDHLKNITSKDFIVTHRELSDQEKVALNNLELRLAKALKWFANNEDFTLHLSALKLNHEDEFESVNVEFNEKVMTFVITLKD